MARPGPKRRLYEQFARIGAALSSAGRLELLEVLAQGERTVEALARETGLSMANASHHLNALRDAGLVRARKAGLYVHYRLSGPEVDALLRLLRGVGERHLEEVSTVVEKYFTARDELEPVSGRELLARAREGTVLVLDVRPRVEFEAGHIPGALSVPLDELADRLGELPRGQEVVAYCRSAYCVLAFKAVELLRARGRKARRLEGGLPEWRAAGLEVETMRERES